MKSAITVYSGELMEDKRFKIKASSVEFFFEEHEIKEFSNNATSIVWEFQISYRLMIDDDSLIDWDLEIDNKSGSSFIFTVFV